MGAGRRRRSASGEAGWTARLLDANGPDVEVQRLGADEDRLHSGDGNRQDPARLHGRPRGRSVAERAVLGVRRISRLPAGVQRRRGSWKIGPADREGEWLAARGHEAGGDQRVKYHGDQQNAGHELAPAAIEESRAHVLQQRAAAFFGSLSVQTRARESRAPYRELLHYPTAAYPARSARSPRSERLGVATLMSIDWPDQGAPRSFRRVAACAAPCARRRTVAGVR